MIILAYDWWDEWMNCVSRSHYIMALWSDHPLTRMVKYPPYIAIDGSAWSVYDIDGMNIYWRSRYLNQLLDSLREQLTFTI